MEALAGLSEAEKKALRALAACHTAPAAAASLCLAESTIRTHAASARRKLGFTRTQDAVDWLLAQERASEATMAAGGADIPGSNGTPAHQKRMILRGSQESSVSDEGVPLGGPESRSQYIAEPSMPACSECERKALPSIRQRLQGKYQPEGPVEESLVDHLAHLQWELAGLYREEQEVADQVPPASAGWRMRFAEERSRLVELQAKAFGHLKELQGERGHSGSAGREQTTDAPEMRRQRESRE